MPLLRGDGLTRQYTELVSGNRARGAGYPPWPKAVARRSLGLNRLVGSGSSAAMASATARPNPEPFAHR